MFEDTLLSLVMELVLELVQHLRRFRAYDEPPGVPRNERRVPFSLEVLCEKVYVFVCVLRRKRMRYVSIHQEVHLP